MRQRCAGVDKDMVQTVLLLFLMFIPGTVLASNLVSASYSQLYSFYYKKFQEGLLLTFDMPAKRTRFSVGLHTASYQKTTQELSPIGINVDIEGLFATLPLEARVDITDLQYEIESKSSIISTMLFGEYSYYNKKSFFGKKKIVPRNSHELNMFAGGGIRYNIETVSKKYKLYVGDEYFDSVKNPLAGNKSSGIKFFLSNNLSYRFSMVHIGLLTGISIPSIKQSFLSLQAGFTI